MANLFPLDQIARYSLFESFNKLYGDQLLSICSPLGKFQINIMAVDDYKSNSGNPGSQGQEIFADEIVCKVGLGQELLSVIDKLEESGRYPDSLGRFGTRKEFLSAYNINPSE